MILKISDKIPRNTKFFKVPHHGSFEGEFETENSSYLDRLDRSVFANINLGISCHNAPYGHPDNQVIEKFEEKDITFFRTDRHHHLTFSTDSKDACIKYSDFEDTYTA